MTNKQFDVLYSGQYADLVDADGRGYECLHENDAIFFVPILVDDDKILIRYENIPPYNIKGDPDQKYYTIMSETVEEGEEEHKTLLRGLKEEAGLVNIEFSTAAEIKNAPVCKSTDLRADVLVMEITDYDQIEPESDGSFHEEQSETKFINADEFHEIANKDEADLLLHLAYLLLAQIYM